jgi:histidyl-tRNA synthetase
MPAKKKTPEKKIVKKIVKKTAAKKPVKKSAAKKVYHPLRGMRDLLPKDEKYWKEMYHTAEGLAEAYVYGRIETPVLEQAGLFVRSIGKGTDVVDKEMYTFEVSEGKVALRPESTASVVRAFITNGLHVEPQPVKLWYWGPMFRHDRPQAGRYRQFYQFSCENFGEKNPVCDAELITIAYNFYRDLGIDVRVDVNSIGTLEEREQYIVELVGYFRSKRSYLSEESKKRINKNPLRILDSKDEGDIEVLEDAPQIIDWLSEDSKKYFMKILEYLDELEIPYVLNSKLVRGLDYYSDTVFEFFLEDEEHELAGLALGGGGRYDVLVEQMGGPETPGCGFGLGLDRVAKVLEKQRKDEPKETFPLFFAHLGEAARQVLLRILEELRREGLYVQHNLAKSALKSQLEIANKNEAKYTFILGQKEVQDGTIIVRDMDAGTQETIDQKKIVKEVKKILGIK